MELLSRFIAFSILILLLPILLIISLLSLLFQGLPILYKQERVGYKYEHFKIYKFRTMVNNFGDLITKYNDYRITFLGRILRKTKLDELPQLINIIKGEMRFIGPRPEVPDYFSIDKFQFLGKIKPGMSDYASIIFRDEAKILERIGGNNPYLQLLTIKLELAEYYSRKKSFLLDLKLVIITLIAIIFPDFSSRVLIIPNLLSKHLPKTNKFLEKFFLLVL